jgi:hypothetical protein
MIGTDIQQLNLLIDTIKLTKFSTDELITLLSIKKELKVIASDVNETMKLIAQKYDLPNTSQGYMFLNHPKEKEIQADVDAIYKKEYTTKANYNFIDLTKLVESINENHSIDNLLILTEYLAKK